MSPALSTNLPPLQSLKAFILAAEHESFKQAALELHLTPSAISHQIKGLEEVLGLELFRRQNRQIKLTPAGQLYLKVVEQTLHDLSAGTEKLKRNFSQNVLRASIPPMIATDFVIPNLDCFHEQYPDIELRLETSLQWAQSEREDLDIVLYFGLPNSNSDVTFEKIMPISVTPTMTQAFYDEHQPNLSTLNNCRLIHSSVVPDGWSRYLETFDGGYQQQSNDIWLDSYTSMIQSCATGHGITLGLLPLLQQRIDQGELICPFEQALEVPEAIYLIYRNDKQLNPAIEAFAHWIKTLLHTSIR